MPEHFTINTTYHDPLDNFTDREEILALVEQLLRSAQPGQLRVLAIKGNSGTGKTFLVEYLSKRICPSVGWETGQLHFFQSQPDFRTILTALEDALKGCVSLSEDFASTRADITKAFAHQNLQADTLSPDGRSVIRRR